MREPKNKQNYPNKRKEGYFPGTDERTGPFDADFDDYSDYEETLEFLKTGKTLGGRRFK
ncbi:MAG TPA: hypothetical protein GXX34_10700 [Clostridia bacterium]|nr:hypothetical protein [Clostridia bacterium]